MFVSSFINQGQGLASLWPEQAYSHRLVDIVDKQRFRSTRRVLRHGPHTANSESDTGVVKRGSQARSHHRVHTEATEAKH